jgi:hypothetical protein
MKCTTAEELLFRRIDQELSEQETAALDAHLDTCASCNREYRILRLPSRIAQTLLPVEPSPFFYEKLRRNIEGEAQQVAGWNIFTHLARQVIPALAGITLALLTVFAYIQFTGSEPDLYKAYDRVFITEEQPHQMLSEGDITDESVLNAIAEQDASRRHNLEMK